MACIRSLTQNGKDVSLRRILAESKFVGLATLLTTQMVWKALKKSPESTFILRIYLTMRSLKVLRFGIKSCNPKHEVGRFSWKLLLICRHLTLDAGQVFWIIGESLWQLRARRESNSKAKDLIPGTYDSPALPGVTWGSRDSSMHGVK